MQDYNAKIISQCFLNELDYIHGLYAIKRELRKTLKTCRSCKRKFLQQSLNYVHYREDWCDECNEPSKHHEHVQFDYCKILTKDQTEYNCFDYLPNEIVSLIFSNLTEYEVMNFYMAIQKCDKENLKKIIEWAKRYGPVSIWRTLKTFKY